MKTQADTCLSACTDVADRLLKEYKLNVIELLDTFVKYIY